MQNDATIAAVCKNYLQIDNILMNNWSKG